MEQTIRPGTQGLYNPEYEHDSCGVGFVAHLAGAPRSDILPLARDVLVRMTHRGAVGAEENTGDGAGVLTALPQEFLRAVLREELSLSIPDPGQYALGMIFLPPSEEERQACQDSLAWIAREEGFPLLGWRDLPRDNSMIGPSARASEPMMVQMFLGAPAGMDQESFERKLYVLRKKATRTLRGSSFDQDNHFYIASLSSRTMVYKGMLTPEQLFRYYRDLQDPRFLTPFAMVHSRFSTNTFPSWDRAQPLRCMSHNGEINTLRGNVNKMRARQGVLRSDLFGDGLEGMLPVFEPDLSDSGSFDNLLELLLRSGRELPEAVMMMVPEAWQGDRLMSDERRALYEFMSAQMEPWDGPASIVFTDGTVLGAVLDRNGLRPSRYCVTDEGLVVMASEAGTVGLDPARVVKKGRLQPGRMFLVDFSRQRIVDDEEIKRGYARKHPYRTWIDEQKLTLEMIPDGDPSGRSRSSGSGQSGDADSPDVPTLLREFGYTREHLELILKVMAETGKEPLGSMGNDTPLAVLSERPRLVCEYFKQLFAQVTNPPIDSIREEIVMSLGSFIGPEGNLLAQEAEAVHRLWLDQPILSEEEMEKISSLDHRGWRSLQLDCTYSLEESPSSEDVRLSDPEQVMNREGQLLEAALASLAEQAESAINQGVSLIILSDRNISSGRVPVPVLLATGAVHHHLVRVGKRARVGLVVESGEPREVHHVCTLLGYGADAIHPYLAYQAITHMQARGEIESGLSREELFHSYRSALEKGMRKVFGKMGISTLESYKGAQIFEILGLSREVVERCFEGTASRIAGAGFAQLARESLLRHRMAFPLRPPLIGSGYLEGGDYKWRAGGEVHLWGPQAIADLQQAVRFNDRQAFSRFSSRQNEESAARATLRGLLSFHDGGPPIPLEEVEPVEAIMRRFVTGAMSYGSISAEAHEALAVAMNRIGGKSNTGEGGEDPARFHPLPGGDSKRSAIKQVASGRFGVTIEYLANSDEIQIKMAQGAKPGEGGELPGHKVFDRIAATRHSTPGVGLISPPPHHDIYSIEDLAQLIFDLKNANEAARISVKLVSEVGVGTVAAGVAKAHADHILVSGHDGGTGASPLTGIKNAGVPWELGLAETHQTLVMNDLRSRVVLQVDGQIKTGRDVVIAALLGAEEMGFATSALISLGCVMMRKCEKNTCPVGIATQNEKLREKFQGKPEDVVAMMQFIAQETREIMARLGFRRFDEMVGRRDLLRMSSGRKNWKSAGVDLSDLLAPLAVSPEHSGVICCQPQNHGLEDILDRAILAQVEPLLDPAGGSGPGEPISLEFALENTDRSVGTFLSNQIVTRLAPQGLEPDSIHIRLRGSAGQSFGAWLARGVTLELEGEANDYVGKGLSGGRVIVYPPRESAFAAEENVIVGNVAFYGATSGEAFVRGLAAERFCVRNSGAWVVVEGLGDHGLEYMTGGRALVLGEVGKNFAAGMSGGVAWVWDPLKMLPQLINPEMVELSPLDRFDEEELLPLLRRHQGYTGSVRARQLLDDWPLARERFVRVISPAYRGVMETLRERSSGDLRLPGISQGNSPKADQKEEVLHG
ncbi:glutamate synthase (NADH) large subunit [Alkalispirochaeta americana]|uniref:Glutamate synthase [NADPH] large chain n=1 Tax=Alkalispirochaeta americana TaxID=159291 RepID=A0A1N6R0Y4_9SPIO|nr:glutamate synthase large subunit [Alkalispirochaeta americana]SIQ22570.1 glutamate synthase (NADH) large subunit [Alkalispirochaeta americana]